MIKNALQNDSTTAVVDGTTARLAAGASLAGIGSGVASAIRRI